MKIDRLVLRSVLIVALTMIVSAQGARADSPFQVCNEGLKYSRAWQIHQTDRLFQDNLRHYIIKHDYKSIHDQFDVGATVPVKGVPVKFNLDEGTYVQTQNDLRNELNSDVTEADTDYLMQTWVPDQGFEAYESCLDRIEGDKLTCSVYPTNDPTTKSVSLLRFRWTRLGSAHIDDALVEEPAGISFTGKPLKQRNLKAAGFPPKIPFSHDGSVYILSRSEEATKKATIITINYTFREGGVPIPGHCVLTIPAITPPPPAPPAPTPPLPTSANMEFDVLGCTRGHCFLVNRADIYEGRYLQMQGGSETAQPAQTLVLPKSLAQTHIDLSKKPVLSCKQMDNFESGEFRVHGESAEWAQSGRLISVLVDSQNVRGETHAHLHCFLTYYRFER